MAGLKIEGDLDDITETQIQYIKDVLEKRGYKDEKVLIEPVGKVGDNYMANVKRIKVEDKNGGIFKMIAKLAPTNELIREMSNAHKAFKNEHIMYTKVLPKYDEFQRQADVPEEERLKYASCYGSFNDAPNEVILLEDLNVLDFKIMDRLSYLSNECVKSVLKNFALLHSLSFVLKLKEPEQFNELKNSLFDTWSVVSEQEETKQYFILMEASALSIMEKDTHKKVIKGIISKSLDLLAKLPKIDIDAKSAVIQQGDAWTNNIMFKIDGENHVQSIFIDYQISKVCNPVVDLLYMIFNCTDYQSRKEHFHDWIDYYHDEFEKSLSTYGIKANYVFPRDQLDADLKRYGKMNLGLCIVVASVTLMKPEEAAQIKAAMETADINLLTENSNLRTLGDETLALFKTKVEGLIDSNLELGLI